MERLKQDFIVALRRLRATPGFALAAILTLALGIGANTAIFTAVNALVLRTIPVDHPEQLFAINTKILKNDFPVQSYPNYVDTRDRSASVADIAAYRLDPMNVSRGGENSRAWGYLVTGNYFDMLGVNAGRGRMLHREDDVTRGGHPVAVISYAYWQRRFAADPGAVGSRIKLNGMDYTVVGVTPRDF